MWVYSLGERLLLAEAGRTINVKDIYFMALFVDIAQEERGSKKLSKQQIAWLYRLVEQEPREAINRFYDFAGINDHIGGELPYTKSKLLWGLSCLLETKVNSIESVISQLIFGEDDRLIERFNFEEKFPGVEIVKEAGHDYRDLISHLKMGME